ncbi:MAG: hypothetical protein M3Z04_23085 [Chloroflexota bacterium]|nr:hypothetical protein [Chloroflexota bacterium]
MAQTRGVDLNVLREILIKRQQEGGNAIVPAQEKVWIDNEGKIKTANQIQPGQERRLTEMQQNAVFASSSRMLTEQAVVTEKFPRGTHLQEVDNVAGWFYEFNDEYSQPYTMFIYHDGSLYQVQVVFPEVAGKYNVHNAHLWPDGRICLIPDGNGGMSDFAQTYARSVLWANGFTAFLHSGKFPFSLNNE